MGIKNIMKSLQLKTLSFVLVFVLAPMCYAYTYSGYSDIPFSSQFEYIPSSVGLAENSYSLENTASATPYTPTPWTFEETFEEMSKNTLELFSAEPYIPDPWTFEETGMFFGSFENTLEPHSTELYIPDPWTFEETGTFGSFENTLESPSAGPYIPDPWTFEETGTFESFENTMESSSFGSYGPDSWAFEGTF